MHSASYFVRDGVLTSSNSPCCLRLVLLPSRSPQGPQSGRIAGIQDTPALSRSTPPQQLGT